MSSVLGVDIGGTKIAAAPVGRHGEQLAAPLVALSRVTDVEAFVTGLEQALRQALQQYSEFTPVALGIACAGTVDYSHGVVVVSPNLPLVDFPLVKVLRERLGLPVFLENDANAALLGEAASGAAVGMRHVVLLTLGTGVGGGVLVNGELYRGASGAAGELGHMTVVRGGLACRCGGRGCLEMYASGPALVRYAAAFLQDSWRDPGGQLLALHKQGRLTGGSVARLAREGHPGAIEAVQQLGEWLGVGLVNITSIFEPEMIVVGGGVGEMGEMLLQPARSYLARYGLLPGRDRVRVVSAKLGNTAGLVGGALVAWQELEADAGCAGRA